MDLLNITKVSFKEGPVSVVLATMERLPEGAVSFPLSERDREYSANFKNKDSLKSFYSARFAASELISVEDLHYEGQRPLLKSGNHLSLSHTHGWGAAVTSKYSVGVDIEFDRPQIFRIAKKFVNEVEVGWVEKGNIDHLHAIWGAKESVFKMYGLGSVDFRGDITVMGAPDPTTGQFIALFKNRKTQFEAKMYYKKIKNMHLVFGFRN